MNKTFIAIIIAVAVLLLMFAYGTVSVMGQRRSQVTARATSQQPLFSEFNGVRLGMTSDEVHKKLGDAAMRDGEQDYYVLPGNKAVQVIYDVDRRVIAISIDYLGGIGAPEPRVVVGGELELKPSGSAFRMVRYESDGFWVSYNRSAPPVIMVTITIQKM